MTYKIQIDNFLFNVNVTEYIPEIPGTWDKRADNPDEFYGVPLTLDWSCTEVVERQDCVDLLIHNEDDALEIVDAYAEQIKSKLLDAIHFEQECADEVW